jgi:arylformamidase
VKEVTGIDYEVEYNNRARVPENPALMAGWARDAAAYREQRAPRRITYGPGARHAIDLFAGDGQDQDKAPLVVFIHGGYWQALDGSWFSHMARGLNAHGVTVAVPTYDLCPQVSVAEIIEEMRQATRELAKLSERLVISGHSAGGHLAACMLATDWKAYDASLPPRLVSAAYAISGLFELEPLVPLMAAWMRWSANWRARNITGKAGPSLRSGERRALPRGSAPCLWPIISPRLPRSPIRLRP